MISSFRRLSKSKVGTIVLALFLLAIVASFAMQDIQNVAGGNFGMSSGTLASAGSEEITDRDLSRALERRLTEVRQQNPEADYSALASDFDPILSALIDQRALSAFAADAGFVLSRRLIDAEIANIPGTRGLDGRFSDTAYQAFLAQQRMSDAEVRQLIGGSLIQRLILTPLATSARVPVGVARPYAAMLLEARQGDVAMIPIEPFRAGLKPTDSDLQRFYAANRNRYMVPEQRVLRLARIGPEQVAKVGPTDQEILAYYNANQATYGAKDLRVLSQAVAPDRATAEQIAARAKSGGSFAAAAAPAGFSAEDVSLGEQDRSQFSGVAGEQVAAAVFGAAQGAVVGPIQSDLGWHVVKVESVRRQGGRPLAAVRAEIAARLGEEKRREALTDLVTRIEEQIDGGANFTEAAAVGKLQITETPPLTAAGVARTNPGYRFPAELAPALKAGFELMPSDDPAVETLPGESGYVIVQPARVIPAAPEPLASIRDRVTADWISQQAARRAQAVASQIAAKTARNVPLAQAVREAGVALPPIRPIGARRLDLSQLQGGVPAPLRMLFTLGQGRSRMVADPQGRGFYVVKVNRIVPGNPLSNPAIIARVQQDFSQPLAQEYAQQFMAAVRAEVGVKRNDKAIAAAKTRIVGGGS